MSVDDGSNIENDVDVDSETIKIFKPDILHRTKNSKYVFALLASKNDELWLFQYFSLRFGILT